MASKIIALALVLVFHFSLSEKTTLSSLNVHIPTNHKLRIIGGNETVPHSVPYQVGLMINKNAFCGGVLISPNYVLTAAHCGVVIRSVEVILGAHNRTELEPTQKRLTSKEVTVHEGFSSETYVNDVALIKLPESVEFNEYIDVVRLPKRADANQTYVDEIVRATGWGLTVDTDNPRVKDISEVLMYLDVKVMDNSECGLYYDEDDISYVTSGNVCTSGYKAKGTCDGDSGGPIVLNGTVIGLVSFGSTLCEACTPSVYAKVDQFLDWIEEHSDVVVEDF